MLQYFIHLFQAYRLKHQTRQAIRQATELAQSDGRKYLVLLYKGKPTVVSKQQVKRLIRQHKFHKGVTIADIERAAIFISR